MNVRTLNVSGSTTTTGITDNNTFLGIVANQLNVSNGLATGSLQVNYNSTMTGNLAVTGATTTVGITDTSSTGVIASI